MPWTAVGRASQKPVAQPHPPVNLARLSIYLAHLEVLTELAAGRNPVRDNGADPIPVITVRMHRQPIETAIDRLDERIGCAHGVGQRRRNCGGVKNQMMADIFPVTLR